jgi:ribose 5-phosphate isomerase B
VVVEGVRPTVLVVDRDPEMTVYGMVSAGSLCHCVFTAQIARAHNDANVLVMGAKVVAPDLAERILAVWLATRFKGGRHQLRVDQISALERGESLV